MSSITVSNLTFAYEGSYDNIFENVSFQIDTNWKLGLIGRNGRGKTTLLNLLLGNYPYSGVIHRDIELQYFPYPVQDQTQNTLDILATLCPEAEEWELMRELSLLDLDAEVLYRPFETLSSGEQTKALLAALFLGSNRFLLIDEPTNHLDPEARRVVGSYLKGKQGFILVSHDRALLDACVDHILSINRNNIEIQQGNFSSWYENKQRQDNFEQAENAKLQKEIGRLSAAARQTSAWSDQTERSKHGVASSGLKKDRGFWGHKAAKMMKRSKNIEARRQEALAEKSQLLRNIDRQEDLKLSPLPYFKERLAEARDLSLFYDGLPVCGPLTFSVCQGERVALSGKNGSGKSSLLKLICGEEISHSGSLQVGSGLILSYVPQDASFLQGDLNDFAEQKNIDETLFKTILRKLGFERVQFEKDIADYSDGQKKKVLLAGSFCQKAHLYVWDEPLNFIDLFSRMQIEDLLLQFRPTLLFVEHDARFRETIATKTLQL